MNTSKNEAVVLLHGLGLCALHMKKIEFILDKEGYDVINIDYSSRKYDINQSTELIEERLKVIRLEIYTKVHFIGHSLGSILIRNMLSRSRLSNQGMVIALAPPNCGSLLADRLSTIKLFRWFFGPAAVQLSTDSSFLQTLKHIPTDYYVIAGAKSKGTLFGHWFEETNDGTVSLKSTKVSGMKSENHSVHTATHIGMLYNKSVVEEIVDILK